MTIACEWQETKKNIVKSEKNIVLDINDPSNFYFMVHGFARPLLEIRKKNQKGIFEASRGLTLKFLRFFISFKNILIKIQSMLLHGFVPD